MTDNLDRGRRGLIFTAIAGVAAYATSLVVTKTAHAAECLVTCTQAPNGCIQPVGICTYDSESRVQYVFLDKPPYGDCCAGWGGDIVCWTFGSAGPCGG